jgi:NAD(P)-dependent dehydrogenase (short-subunit alcohol dehydrogenase family)
MDMRLRDRVVLVTGGASGIGQACVEAVTAEGGKVLLIDRDPEGSVIAGELTSRGHQVEFVQADITEEADVRRCIQAAYDRFGQLDAVIACAGISGPVGTPAVEVEVADWDKVMAVNVRGNFLLAKYAIPLLKHSDVAAMVFLASDSALVAFEGMAPYTASKGAVLMLTKALAVDHPQVRVNCLCPSVVDTPMSRSDMGRRDGFAGTGLPVVQPQQVAAHALFLASPVSAPINGTGIVADHGYLARSAQPALEFS